MINTTALFAQALNHDANAMVVVDWVLDELVGVGCEGEAADMTEAQQAIFAAIRAEHDADPEAWLECWAEMEDEAFC
jgi:hypothetical protein